jgi:hypothetical protein
MDTGLGWLGFGGVGGTGQDKAGGFEKILVWDMGYLLKVFFINGGRLMFSKAAGYECLLAGTGSVCREVRGFAS